MIKQLLNSVIAKHPDLSVSRRSVICLSLWLLQIIKILLICLLLTNQDFFPQPGSIIKYLKTGISNQPVLTNGKCPRIGYIISKLNQKALNAEMMSFSFLTAPLWPNSHSVPCNSQLHGNRFFCLLCRFGILIF
mgnify:CR=1 FL=1